MAFLKQAKTENEIKALTIAKVKNEYNSLANDYNKVINLDYVYCPHCGDWKSASAFYASNKTKSGIEHFACKACILDMCTDYDKKTGIRTDSKEKTIETFRQLDWYFNEAAYFDQLKTIKEGTGEKVRSTAVQQWIVMYRSLPNWRGFTFKDSEFLDNGETLELATNRKPRKEILKIFGSGFTTEDYLYLQDQYDDWRSRTQVDGKSQETYIIQICFKQLEIWKAQKSGKDTDKLIKSLNDLMNGANLQPRQNVGNAATDNLTFGQLIEKWEQEAPISDPDPEFADVNGISNYIKTWFAGHLSRCLGLDNGFNREYDEYVEKYTVKTEENLEEETVSDNIYEALFGNSEG